MNNSQTDRTRPARVDKARRFVHSVCICAALLFPAIALRTQPLQLDLQVAPNLPQYLADWELDQSYFTLRVLNFGTQPIEAKMRAVLQNGSGANVASTDFYAMQALLIQPGQTEFHTLDIFPAGALVLSPDFEQAMGTSGMLPEDNYQLCVTLVDPLEGAPLSQPACHFFFIQGLVNPELLLPPDGQAVAFEALQEILFQWTPLMPPQSFPVNYELRVVQVFPGQNIQEAILVNAPVFQGNLGSLTQTPLPPGLQLPNENATYAWTIIPTRETGQPMIPLEHAPPPFTFSVNQTVTQPPCQCGDCFINGISIYYNGNLVTPSGGVRQGDNLVFVPNYIAQCPPGCPLSFKGDWKVQIVDANGNVVFQSSANSIDTLHFPPPKAGKLIITFTGTAFCKDQVCPCGSGTATLDVTVRPGETTPPGATDPTAPPPDVKEPGEEVPKPPPPETVPQDSIVPPTPEKVPEDTIKIPPEEPPGIPTIINCAPTVVKDPATPISIGALLSEPPLFDYPRAVALRAEGIDYDRVTFICEGCRSGSNKEVIVRDLVDKFHWELDGKGSLDVPFDLKLIDSTANQLKKMAAKLAALEKTIEDLKKEIEEKPAKMQAEKDKAKAQLLEVEKRLTQIDSTLTVIADSLQTLKTSIAEAVQTIRFLLDENEQMAKDTAANAVQIDTIKNLLAGKPSPQEEAKLLEVDATRQAASNADSLVSWKRQEILHQAASLRAAIEAAEQALLAATQSYNAMLGNVEGVALTISQLETQRFKKPGGQAFHTKQNRWNNIASSLSATFFTQNPSLTGQLSSRQDSVNLKAELAVSQGTQAQRSTRREAFNFAVDFYQTLVNGGCNALADTTVRKQCQQSAEVLQSETDAFKLAVENAGGYTLDPQVSQQLETLRTQLEGMEGAIKTAEAGVAAAGQQYESAVSNYASTMSQLEQQKQSLASQAEQAHNSLALKENEYLEMKEGREQYVEQNREQLQQSLHHLELENQTLGFNMHTNLDSIGELREDTARWHFSEKMSLALMQDLETEKQRLLALKANLEAILAKSVEEELKKLKDSLQILNKEKEKLLAALDSLKNLQQNLLTGNKTATGPIVYYIPPPLEEIMQDKPRFEELKAKVEKAEAKLEVAYAEKAALQEFLTKNLEKIAAELVRYKLAGDEKTALEQQQQELQNKLDQLKNEKTLDYQQAQAKLLDQLDEAENKLKFAEQKIEELEQDSIQKEAEMEAKRQEIEAQQQVLQQLLQQWGDMKAQRQFEENQLENIKGTVRTKNDQLLEEQVKLRDLESALATAEDALGRATARKDNPGKLTAQAEINTVKPQLNLQKTKVENLKADLESAANSLAAKRTALQQAIESFEQAAEAFREAERELEKLKEELFQLNEEHRKILQELKIWRKIKEELEAEVQDVNEKRREYQQEVADAVDAEEDVAAVQKQLDETAKAIEDANKRSEESEKEAGEIR
jgi:chromosome segregation ATPase